jgi:hypothetical protein
MPELVIMYDLIIKATDDTNKEITQTFKFAGIQNDYPVYLYTKKLDTINIDINTSKQIPLQAQLGSDYDDNDEYTKYGDVNTEYELISQPSNGSIELKDDGTYWYTPNIDYNGKDNFKYKAVMPKQNYMGQTRDALNKFNLEEVMVNLQVGPEVRIDCSVDYKAYIDCGNACDPTDMSCTSSCDLLFEKYQNCTVSCEEACDEDDQECKNACYPPSDDNILDDNTMPVM